MKGNRCSSLLIAVMRCAAILSEAKIPHQRLITFLIPNKTAMAIDLKTVDGLF